jgi:hypothetical protein
MSPKRWALSLFFVWHLVAITLGSLMSPGAMPPIPAPRHPTNDVFAAAMTPSLDRLAAMISPLPAAILRNAGPVRVLAADYLSVTGVSQSWKMFSNPPLVDQYLRVRYYVGLDRATGQNGQDASWTATELVLPAHREDRVRLVQGYWDAFRDKAMTSALARFDSGRSDRLNEPNTKSADLPDDLAPIARYFARRFQRDVLRPDERVVRTEIWYGVAPMPRPGELPDSRRVEDRQALLRRYYEGPVENHFGTPVVPPYHSAQVEADITWYLEYFEP